MEQGEGRRFRAVTQAHVRFAPKSERTVIIEIGPGLATHILMYEKQYAASAI